MHDSIGVFGAVSVATACLLPGSVAADISGVAVSEHAVLDIEHPTGYFSVTLDVSRHGDEVVVDHAALVRTARLLMRGDVLFLRRCGPTMIIDCHGHYTTAPEAHNLWRKAQVAAYEGASPLPYPTISDDEIVESIERISFDCCTSAVRT